VANWHHSGGFYTSLRKVVFQREPLICGLCGRVIDKELRHPDRGSYTLDMIIPRSRGGQKIASNYQPAHRFCNIQKLNGRPVRVAAMTITDEDEP
jgi:5-methylcytosine-specific restriction endonuclease McrA